MYYEVSIDDPLEDKKFGFSLSSSLFYQFEKDTEITKLWALNGWRGIAIPYYDEFIPAVENIPVDTIRVFTALINIDEKHPTNLLSLKELGSYELHQSILAY